MISIFSRLWALIRGIFSKQVRELELKNAEVVYENALERQRSRIHDMASGLAGSRVALEQLRNNLKDKLEELQAVEFKLRAAIESRDTHTGPVLLSEKKRLEAETVQAKQDIEEMELEEAQLEERIRRARSNYMQLKRERATNVAKIKALQASRQANAIFDEFFSASEDRALHDLRERIALERQKSQVMAELNGEPGSREYTLEQEALKREFLDLCNKESTRMLDRGKVEETSGDESNKTLSKKYMTV